MLPEEPVLDCAVPETMEPVDELEPEDKAENEAVPCPDAPDAEPDP